VLPPSALELYGLEIKNASAGGTVGTDDKPLFPNAQFYIPKRFRFLNRRRQAGGGQ
jgi:hypothetical protein